MDGSVLHDAVSTEEILEVLKPASKDGCVVSEEVLSIRTALRRVKLVGRLIEFRRGLYSLRDQRIIGFSMTAGSTTRSALR